MYCPFCGKESWKEDVCTECGVVFYMSELTFSYTTTKGNMKRETNDGPVYNEYFSDLSPDIEYRHKYSKYAKGKELNRALKRQKKRYLKKPEAFFYKKDYTKISGICAILRIPNGVREEALNLRLQVGKTNEGYFRKNNIYKCIACIKLACRVRDFPVEEMELISMVGGYSESDTLKGNKHRKKINDEYTELLKITKIRIERLPKSPNYIPYICSKLGLDSIAEAKIRKEYQTYIKKLKPNFTLKGYILAIIYILYKKEKKIRLTDLEKASRVSRTTIASRVRDIKRIMGVK